MVENSLITFLSPMITPTSSFVLHSFAGSSWLSRISLGLPIIEKGAIQF
jgi:hypothetical protein